MSTMREFVSANRIKMTAERTENNPSMDDYRDMDHWKCKLTRTSSTGARRSFTVVFSQGYGHGGKAPKAHKVLNCLASDASSVANSNGYEDWAADLGFDPDSRKGEKTYRTIERQALRLASFLGGALYVELLNTEQD